uniref:Uncharacterized protein n=1 Tax=Chromera velia CCMP2878 TaxID=1169474 RepID=A0A0G4FG44_9ALVE|eukprot:Cvel_16830.t1-p1 / transcript=Cvel_16830.t1 / gene=Cvel_16830 / organism=Chromera_velia_CCMP2878 / gene_product=hypothetical protein / transcript_product=hypothetical protein / location=Cvel_scaffold1315:5241-19677(-) / protein_length=2394 / sequence_SO=supercontig / SO=protein_coding / is_pseudo=false
MPVELKPDPKIEIRPSPPPTPVESKEPAETEQEGSIDSEGQLTGAGTGTGGGGDDTGGGGSPRKSSRASATPAVGGGDCMSPQSKSPSRKKNQPRPPPVGVREVTVDESLDLLSVVLTTGVSLLLACRLPFLETTGLGRRTTSEDYSADNNQLGVPGVGAPPPSGGVSVGRRSAGPIGMVVRSEGVTCVRLNRWRRQAAFGLQSGVIELHSLKVFTPVSAGKPFCTLRGGGVSSKNLTGGTVLSSSSSSASSGGAVTSMAWTSEGLALAVGWESGSVAVFSHLGLPLLSPTSPLESPPHPLMSSVSSDSLAVPTPRGLDGGGDGEGPSGAFAQQSAAVSSSSSPVSSLQFYPGVVGLQWGASSFSLLVLRVRPAALDAVRRALERSVEKSPQGRPQWSEEELYDLPPSPSASATERGAGGETGEMGEGQGRDSGALFVSMPFVRSAAAGACLGPYSVLGRNSTGDGGGRGGFYQQKGGGGLIVAGGPFLAGDSDMRSVGWCLVGSDRIVLVTSSPSTPLTPSLTSVSLPPPAYSLPNWPLRLASLSPQMDFLLVSGTLGFAVCVLRSSKWRLMGSTLKERTVSCEGLGWYSPSLFFAVYDENGGVVHTEDVAERHKGLGGGGTHPQMAQNSSRAQTGKLGSYLPSTNASAMPLPSVFRETACAAVKAALWREGRGAGGQPDSQLGLSSGGGSLFSVVFFFASARLDLDGCAARISGLRARPLKALVLPLGDCMRPPVGFGGGGGEDGGPLRGKGMGGKGGVPPQKGRADAFMPGSRLPLSFEGHQNGSLMRSPLFGLFDEAGQLSTWRLVAEEDVASILQGPPDGTDGLGGEGEGEGPSADWSGGIGGGLFSPDHSLVHVTRDAAVGGGEAATDRGALVGGQQQAGQQTGAGAGAAFAVQSNGQPGGKIRVVPLWRLDLSGLGWVDAPLSLRFAVDQNQVVVHHSSGHLSVVWFKGEWTDGGEGEEGEEEEETKGGGSGGGSSYRILAEESPPLVLNVLSLFSQGPAQLLEFCPHPQGFLAGGGGTGGTAATGSGLGGQPDDRGDELTASLNASSQSVQPQAAPHAAKLRAAQKETEPQHNVIPSTSLPVGGTKGGESGGDGEVRGEGERDPLCPPVPSSSTGAATETEGQQQLRLPLSRPATAAADEHNGVELEGSAAGLRAKAPAGGMMGNVAVEGAAVGVVGDYSSQMEELLSEGKGSTPTAPVQPQAPGSLSLPLPAEGAARVNQIGSHSPSPPASPPSADSPPSPGWIVSSSPLYSVLGEEREGVADGEPDGLASRSSHQRERFGSSVAEAPSRVREWTERERESRTLQDAGKQQKGAGARVGSFSAFSGGQPGGQPGGASIGDIAGEEQPEGRDKNKDRDREGVQIPAVSSSVSLPVAIARTNRLDAHFAPLTLPRVSVGASFTQAEGGRGKGRRSDSQNPPNEKERPQQEGPSGVSRTDHSSSLPPVIEGSGGKGGARGTKEQQNETEGKKAQGGDEAEGGVDVQGDGKGGAKGKDKNHFALQSREESSLLRVLSNLLPLGTRQCDPSFVRCLVGTLEDCRADPSDAAMGEELRRLAGGVVIWCQDVGGLSALHLQAETSDPAEVHGQQQAVKRAGGKVDREREKEVVAVRASARSLMPIDHRPFPVLLVAVAARMGALVACSPTSTIDSCGSRFRSLHGLRGDETASGGGGAVTTKTSAEDKPYLPIQGREKDRKEKEREKMYMQQKDVGGTAGVTATRFHLQLQPFIHILVRPLLDCAQWEKEKSDGDQKREEKGEGNPGMSVYVERREETEWVREKEPAHAQAGGESSSAAAAEGLEGLPAPQGPSFTCAARLLSFLEGSPFLRHSAELLLHACIEPALSAYSRTASEELKRERAEMATSPLGGSASYSYGGQGGGAPGSGEVTARSVLLRCLRPESESRPVFRSLAAALRLLALPPFSPSVLSSTLIGCVRKTEPLTAPLLLFPLTLVREGGGSSRWGGKGRGWGQKGSRTICLHPHNVFQRCCEKPRQLHTASLYLLILQSLTGPLRVRREYGLRLLALSLEERDLPLARSAADFIRALFVFSSPAATREREKEGFLSSDAAVGKESEKKKEQEKERGRPVSRLWRPVGSLAEAPPVFSAEADGIDRVDAAKLFVETEGVIEGALLSRLMVFDWRGLISLCGAFSLDAVEWLRRANQSGRLRSVGGSCGKEGVGGGGGSKQKQLSEIWDHPLGLTALIASMELSFGAAAAVGFGFGERAAAGGRGQGRAHEGHAGAPSRTSEGGQSAVAVAGANGLWFLFVLFVRSELPLLAMAAAVAAREVAWLRAVASACPNSALFFLRRARAETVCACGITGADVETFGGFQTGGGGGVDELELERAGPRLLVEAGFSWLSVLDSLDLSSVVQGVEAVAAGGESASEFQ